MPSQLPVAGSVYVFDGQRVRLQGAHRMDSAVWIAHTLEGERQVYIGLDWLAEHQSETVVAAAVVDTAVIQVPAAVAIQPVAVRAEPALLADGTPAPRPAEAAALARLELRRRGEVVPTPAREAAEDPSEADVPVQPVPVTRCPACSAAYTGSLGRDHHCDRVAAVSCRGCRSFNPEHLAHPPRPPYLCSACVTAGKYICKSCAQPQATRGTYEHICNGCNPLPEQNVWARIQNKAQGNDMTILSRSHRPYAVEVENFLMPGEAVSPRRPLGGGWEEAQDGSIQADPGATENVEFRSPPVKGDGGLRLLHEGVKKIRDMGFRANKSCGMHCHVDMISSTVEDRRALYKFGTWIQDDIYKLVARSRSSGTYCKQLRTTLERADRYVWLNMKHAFDRHRTVEFRLHHGTTQPDRVVEWVKVCLRIVETGLKLGRGRTRPSGSMFDLLGFNPYEREYWMDVARSLHGVDVAFTNGGQR